MEDADSPAEEDEMNRIAAALAAALAAVTVFGCSRPAPPAAAPARTQAPPTVDTAAAEIPSAEQTPAEPAKPETVPPKPKPKPTIPTEAEMRSSAGAAALKAAKENSDEAAVGKLSLAAVHVAQDSTGRWWGIAVVRPSKTNVDAVNVLLERKPSGWVAFDLGSGVDSDDERFPADVREKLR